MYHGDLNSGVSTHGHISWVFLASSRGLYMGAHVSEWSVDIKENTFRTAQQQRAPGVHFRHEEVLVRVPKVANAFLLSFSMRVIITARADCELVGVIRELFLPSLAIWYVEILSWREILFWMKHTRCLDIILFSAIKYITVYDAVSRLTP